MTSPSQTKQNVISVSALRIGMRLAEDIYDRQERRLLAAGAGITPEFIHLLKQRGIKSVTTKSNRPRQTNDASGPVQISQLDDLLAGQLNSGVPLRPVDRLHRPRMPYPDLLEHAAEGMRKHAASQIVVAELCDDLQAGQTVSSSGLDQVVGEFADMVALDFDLLPIIVGLQHTPDEYLFNHCVSVALLSMSIAAQLGMNPEQIREVGVGGLLADVGMNQVPEAIRLARRPLTADERMEVLCHPAHTLDCLERIPGLPLPAKFIAYQTHERMDGSGYPRRRCGMLIHQYAKIVAVADAYSAMTGPRPHRAPLPPYQAAKTILVENSRNKFERSIVRAFLDCLSLFPIGSCVQLNNGHKGTVVRANPGLHTRPIIIELDDDERPTDRHIDLSQRPDLNVVDTGPPVPSCKDSLAVSLPAID